MEEILENDDLLRDIVGDLEEASPRRSKFELSPDGYYERWIPSDDEDKLVSEYAHTYIRNLEADNADILREMGENVDAYRAVTKTLGSRTDEDPVVTLPLISRKVDQLVSFQAATILRPRPVISVDPYFDDEYAVMAPRSVEVPGVGMQQMGAPDTFDSEQVAATLEFGLDYKLRERMPLRAIVKKTFQDMAISNHAILKVVWDQKYRTVRTNRVKKLPNGMAVVDGSEERVLKNQDAGQIRNVSLFGFLAPLDCPLDEAELVCELFPMSSTQLREKLTTGDYFLPKRDEWDELLRQTTDDYRLTEDRSISMPGRGSTIERHDTREVWFQWPVEVEEYDEDGAAYNVKKLMSMCGIYHMCAKRFLTLYRNPYHHGTNPYVLITEDEDSLRRPELSMVGRTKTQQTLASQMLHINIQNAVAASNFDIFCNPDSEAWEALQSQGRRPGRLIPRYDKDDVEMAQAGQNHPGLNNEIGLMQQDIADTMGVSPYEEGTMIPGRTPADTVRQILQSGLQRPLMTMSAVSDGFGRAVKMYLQVLRQFNPYGELVPTKNPETNAKIMVPFVLPVEEVLDNFDIALTAAEEELAKEADTEQRIMMFNLLGEASGKFAQMAGGMADVNASPALTALFEELLQINIKALKQIIEPVRKDVTKFLPTQEAIAAIMAEKQQNIMLAMQSMGGGMNGQPPGAPGGAGAVQAAPPGPAGSGGVGPV